MWKTVDLFLAGWIWISFGCISSVLATCSRDIPATNWVEVSKTYPDLMTFFETRTNKLDNLNGSKTLEFINWQDHVVTLACPNTPVSANVKEWTLDYFSVPENKITKEKEKSFKDSHYNSWQLIVDAPLASEYFAVYSCLTIEDCWHHFYIVSKPWPRTTFPVHFKTGENGKFSCSSISRESRDDDPEEFYVNTPLLSIDWRIPKESNASGNIHVLVENKTLNSINSFWNSTVSITEASQMDAGIYECVITDRFGVNSTPETLNGVNLPSGDRYKGVVHVHIRPIEYIFFPIGIGLGLCAILSLLIRFCPVAKDEADLEEDDNDSGIKRVKLNSVGDDSQVLFK